jgi:hypothetical protein
MKTANIDRLILSKLMCLLVALALTRAAAPAAGGEETFEVLQIGTRMYTNVTVTTKALDYVFIVHSSGMENVKLADLSPEIREQLGYRTQPQKSTSTGVSDWARQTLNTGELSQMKELEQAWREHASGRMQEIVAAPVVIAALTAIALVCHLVFSFCAMLICRKAGVEPGILVWLPVLQLIPLIHASGMSRLWFLAWFVPLLNIVAQVIWSVKIVKARGKSGWVTLFLLLPLTNILAFFYLAFSDGGKKEKTGPPAPQIMTLEAV